MMSMGGPRMQLVALEPRRGDRPPGVNRAAPLHPAGDRRADLQCERPPNEQDRSCSAAPRRSRRRKLKAARAMKAASRLCAHAALCGDSLDGNAVAERTGLETAPENLKAGAHRITTSLHQARRHSETDAGSRGRAALRYASGVTPTSGAAVPRKASGQSLPVAAGYWLQISRRGGGPPSE